MSLVRRLVCAICERFEDVPADPKTQEPLEADDWALEYRKGERERLVCPWCTGKRRVPSPQDPRQQ